MANLKAIIFFGSPGCGKGTQSNLVSKEFKFFHLSTGDLLREIKKNENSPFYQIIHEKMSTGQLVSDDILKSIVTEKLKNLQSSPQYGGVIFDGFPRNLHQAEFLKDVLESLNIQLSGVFVFKISEEVVIDRILNRFTCAKCGTVYNKLSKIPQKPNVCDECGAENAFLDRVDDTKEIIQHRLKIFEENMQGLANFYSGQITELNANQTPQEVFDNIKKKLEK